MFKFYILKLLKRKNAHSLTRLIKLTYSIEKRWKKNVVSTVMHYNPSSTEKVYGTERAFPSDEKFLKSGHYKNMLKRYFFPARYFCKNEIVLDSCCGTGWGSYIISNYAKQVDAYDLSSDQINENKREWARYTNNINWISADALQFKSNRQYNIILAMESLEHFTVEQGRIYIKNLYENLSNGGVLIGSTPIIESEDGARRNMQNNPFHLHIYKEKELQNLLSEFFDDVIVHRLPGIGFFFALKK